MKRELLRLAMLAGLISFTATGCYSHRYASPTVTTTPAGAVIVSEAPPPPRFEEPGIAPSTSQAWVQGYWSYRNGRWLWVPGHWEVRPRATATYIPGHWTQTSHGWAWTPGYWQ